jgi:RimJ/RimL family protein N-acetyltransferase
MAELAFGFDEQIAAWVAERIPHVRGGSFGPCAAIGVISNGKLLAGIVYHDYQADQTIQLSMAADNPMWARRSIIAGLLHYPFEQLGVYKVWTMTPLAGEAALRVNYHIGFKREAVLRHQFGKKSHGVVCSMIKPEWQKLWNVGASKDSSNFVH